MLRAKRSESVEVGADLSLFCCKTAKSRLRFEYEGKSRKVLKAATAL